MRPQTRTGVAFLVWGGFIAALGLFLGFTPKGAGCGRPLRFQQLSNVFDRIACEGTLRTWRIVTIVLLVIGVGLIVVGIVALASRSYAAVVPIAPPRPVVAPPAPVVSSIDVTAQLSELARLRDTGALTAEQFETAKARVLEPPPSS